MEFFYSWPLLYRFLFAVCVLVVVLCAFSATVRFITARRTRKLENHAQQELLARPPEPQIRRTNSVNFGVRALDSNETPIEAGIVDSESLRTLSPASPASRWSRVSSPISAGGRKDSDPTIAGIANGGEQDGLLHPPRPPFVNPGRFSDTQSTYTLPQQEGRSIVGLANSPGYVAPRPLSAQYPSGSSSTVSFGRVRSASYSSGLNDAVNPPSQYLQVPGSPRPVSAGSEPAIAGPSSLRPTPSPRPLKGILKNRRYSQSYYADHQLNRRSFTPNTVFGVSPPNIKDPGSPELSPSMSDSTNSRSATPMPRSRPHSSYHSRNLSVIPEVEGPDGIELSDRRVSYAVENVPGTPSPYAIPQPTRAAPSIPFLQSPSPAPTTATPDPHSTTAAAGNMVPPTPPKQNGGMGVTPNKM
ncbi:hypothetical protein TWF696_002356 [Orbilia brochopaga]|uniref:Uncharacterized protein n=1 Tax=Orbilia brochopaga TaxID=3140254 RepID=A0AAV9U4J3_9PEZI